MKPAHFGNAIKEQVLARWPARTALSADVFLPSSTSFFAGFRTAMEDSHK